MKFTLNDKEVSVSTDPQSKLLWYLREEARLTGTKYGCGIGQCGACTVHLNGEPVRSCSIPIAALEGQNVVTIEGLATKTSAPLQQAWIEEQVPQCGYCQSGQIMQAAKLIEQSKNPSRDEITSHMNGVTCRCGTYVRIVKAIKRASKIKQEG